MSPKTNLPIRVMVILSEMGHLIDNRDLGQVVELGRLAEEMGLDGVTMGDHVAMGPNGASEGRPTNPWVNLREHQQPPETPWLDPLLTLAAVSAVTTRVRIGTCILIAPLRQPVVLAKMLASLDVLSNGRLDVGVGTSWQAEEYEAVGVPFAERGARLDELMTVCKGLWQGPFSYHSDTLNFDDIQIEPRPIQPGGPKIWFGGRVGERARRRISDWGAGFFPPPIPGADPRSMVREAMEAKGRDADELELWTPMLGVFPDPDGPADLDATLEGALRQVDAGFDTFVFSPGHFIHSVDEVPDVYRTVRSFFDKLRS